jgi:hypothetical protein
VQQLLYGRLVPLGDTLLKLVAARPKARTPHQVRHQSDIILVCHL